MARKTQVEINYWFQDNTIKSASDLSVIEKVLHINNLDIPNNIIIHKNGSTYDDFAHWYCDETKISKYPTSYTECYDEGNTELHFIYVDKDERDLYESFIQLIRCRNAYWKIAGEELGLGKPWEPDWSNDDETKFCIYTTQNIISLDIFGVDNRIIAFPTEEMRDAFYENFKYLIVACKTLL